MTTSNTADEDVWDQHLYKNWVRGAKGLEFLQYGLEDFVGAKAPFCRDQHLQKIKQVPLASFPQCNQCFSHILLPEHANGKRACKRDSCIQKFASTCFGSKPLGRRKCPNGICSKLYDAIVFDHRHRDPVWKNTDSSTWCSDQLGWSFARCFQTTTGSGTSAKDTDASGLLSFIINSLSMENWLACNYMDSVTTCIFYKARDIRNEILHKAKMELDDQTLDEYLDAFIAVLQDPKCLLVNTAAQEAVNNLTKLKSRQINISQQNETQILKRRNEALSELEERKQEALQEINNMTDKGLSDLNKTSLQAIQNLKDTTSSGILDANKTKTETLQDLKDATSSGILDVTKTKTEALRHLKDATSSVMLDVNKTKTETLTDLKDATSSGVSDVNKTKTEALRHLKDATSSVMLDVNKTKTEALRHLKDATSSVMLDVNKTKTEALTDLKDATSSGVSDVKKTKTEALRDFKDATGCAMSDMNKANSEKLQDLKDTTRSGILEVNKTKTEALRALKDATSSVMLDVNKTRKEALTDLKDVTSSGASDVNKTKTEALRDLADATGCAISDMNNAKTTALQDLKDAKTSGIFDVNKTKTEGIGTLKEATRSGISDVTKTKTDALRDLKDTTGCAKADMNIAKTKTMQDIKDAKSSVMLDVNKKKTEAMGVLKEATRSGISDLTKTKTEALRDLKDATGCTMSDMNKTKTEAMGVVKDATSSGILDVTKTKTEALRDLKVATGTSILNVNKAKREALLEIEGAKSNILEDLKKQSNKIAANDGYKSLTSTDAQSSTTLPEVSHDTVQKKPGIPRRWFQNIFSLKSSRRTGQHSVAVPLPVTQPDEDYIRLTQNLQDDLISFYWNEHRKISLSPLIEETTPLLEFYVMPEIYSLKLQRTRNGVKQEKTAVTPLRNVFYNDNKKCRKIYLTADAGLGKTALSKRLTLAWCHTKEPHEDEVPHFSQEEIQAVKEFRFVFLLLLRDSSNKCEIDDLILAQIIERLGRTYTPEFLENILFKERCLVILDGLDEWSHPSNFCERKLKSIPHQKFRERTTVLTTTRPWKLSVSGLQDNQIDQKLELVGLDQDSANVLKRSVISHMSYVKNENLQDEVEAFTRDVEEKQISDLEVIPLLLMYMLFLWCSKIELGQSQCDIYSQITELLLSRTVQNYIELSPNVGLLQRDRYIPHFFIEKEKCTQFYTLLTDLGQLAYDTLFKAKREENTLVFDGLVAQQHLNKECLNFCLKSGLLTQSKVKGKPLEQKFKVSFAHKTMQEFFAALYMHSTSDQTSVPEIVLSKCKCIKDILEMSKILIFCCGMNVNVSSSISREMIKIINEDEITREYRSSLENYESYDYNSHPLEDFQDMCISCCREMPRINEVKLCLQDVFIVRSCEQEQYCENLKQLTTRNKQNISSLYIDMVGMLDTPYSDVQQVIEYFALNDLENIEKILYKGKYNDHILPVLNRSIKCLYLSCNFSSLSRVLFEKVTSLQKLEAIHIDRFEMSHRELTLLYDYISQRHCLRHIEMQDLRCTDHWGFCTGYSLDLSQHSRLNKLTLDETPLSELSINIASLEKCRLEYLQNPDLVLRFINGVPEESKLNAFKCTALESPVAIETMLETLRLSVHVKHVELLRINLGNREVLTSEMVNIEHVELWRVSMAASVLQGIVDVVQQQPQSITADIHYCDIKPESEFVTVKQKIETSQGRFRIVLDTEDWFTFETIKQGD